MAVQTRDFLNSGRRPWRRHSACRHCNISFPPVGTQEQCAVKSDRHDLRIALACARVLMQVSWHD